MSDCLFCGIVEGTVPADVVHRDDAVMAFRDINPQAPTHVLVIPRKHVASAHDLSEADDALWGRILHVAQRVADAEGVGDGYRMVTSIGSRAGQTVGHLHLHVLGGRQMRWPPG
jgi:histidine triad (HIT) family protein